MIDYGSVCSGIESVSVAVDPLGWKPVWFSEIEPFPSAVLEHRFPDTPNHGDMTLLPARVLRGEIPAPVVLVGGTPCQAFSVAGMRQGLIDPRGALTIKFVETADAIDHVRSARGDAESIVWWENVPGVLSDKGNAFGCFLAALVGESEPLEPSGARWTDAGCVYGPQRTAAWRVLDAQYFGLAQRRRRVFVVASARRGFDPAAVLFESEGVRRDSAPSREARQVTSGSADERPDLCFGCGYEFADDLGEHGCPNCEGDEGPAEHVPAPSGFRMAAFGEYSDDGTASTMKARDYKDATDLVVHGAQDPCISDEVAFALGRNSGQENAVLSVALRGREGGATAELGDDVAGCLRASSGGGDKPHVLAPVAGGCLTPFLPQRARIHSAEGVAPTLSADEGRGHGVPSIFHGPAVRRLTPRECERLQGFPDDWTQIPWRNKPADECPDGPRYKAIGNSKAVPVVRWIARRIQNHI